MKKWMKAVNIFLNDYKNKDYFLGAILTGSYATGNQNNNSDIDIYIVIKDECNWKERGDKLINGYLIEYFIDTEKNIRNYMKEESCTYSVSNTHRFANGKILIDNNSIIENLINDAKDNLNNNSKNIEESIYKMNCYYVWDAFDELEEKYQNKLDIDFSYYYFIEKITNSYLQNSKIPSVALNKIEYILNSDNFRDNYTNNYNHIFCNNKFFKLLKDCFNEKDYDKKFECAKKLYNHFRDKFNDFDINDFSVKLETNNKSYNNHFYKLLKDYFNEKDYNKKVECTEELYNYFKNEFNDYDKKIEAN